MERANKRTGVLGKVLILLSVIIAILTGGYFFLDKLVIPKYFKKYGITGFGELVNVVSSLYSTPKESKMIKNGYSQVDFTNGISKMQTAEYKIEDNGTIKEENMETFKGSGRLELTDREFAAVCNELLQNGLLEKSLSNVNYLNITKLTLLDFIVTPIEDEEIAEGETFSKANISFVMKIETSKLREQIAEQMDTPIYLLKMIIPDNLYFAINYDIDLDNGEARTNGEISINGKTSTKSATLINILISFIFDEQENMDIEKFTEELGSVAIQGIDSLGEFKFMKFSKGYGIVVNESAVVPEP